MRRVLLDEGVTHGLRPILDSYGFPTETVQYRRWAGYRNHKWIRFANAAGFDVAVTADQDLPHQQNLSHSPQTLSPTYAKPPPPTPTPTRNTHTSRYRPRRAHTPSRHPRTRTHHDRNQTRLCAQEGLPQRKGLVKDTATVDNHDIDKEVIVAESPVDPELLPRWPTTRT